MADTRFNINSNEYLPLRDVVFNTLRDAILTGKLVPGERLMENQLAEKLGVSRTPVREALRKLELENLVELVPRKGAQVLDMSEKDIINILEVRGVLEGLATGLACKKMGAEGLAELKGPEERFEKAIADKALEEIAEKSGIDIELAAKIFYKKEQIGQKEFYDLLTYSEIRELEKVFVEADKNKAAEALGAYQVKKQGEYTLEDYYALPDDQRYELIDGVLYDMAAPAVTHQEIAFEIAVALRNTGLRM